MVWSICSSALVSLGSSSSCQYWSLPASTAHTGHWWTSLWAANCWKEIEWEVNIIPKIVFCLFWRVWLLFSKHCFTDGRRACPEKLYRPTLTELVIYISQNMTELSTFYSISKLEATLPILVVDLVTKPWCVYDRQLHSNSFLLDICVKDGRQY